MLVEVMSGILAIVFILACFTNFFQKLGDGIRIWLVGSKQQKLRLESRRLDIEERKVQTEERRVAALERIADTAGDLSGAELSRQIEEALTHEEVVEELRR